MSSTVCASAAEAASDLCPRVPLTVCYHSHFLDTSHDPFCTWQSTDRKSQLQASPPTRVWTSSSTSDLSRPRLRSVSAAAAPTCASWTRTGSTRTRPTSTTRWSSSTPSTRPSASTPASTGSSTRCTSTARLAVSPPPARSHVVSTRATATTRPAPAAERPGRDTTPCLSGATDKHLPLLGGDWRRTTTNYTVSSNGDDLGWSEVLLLHGLKGMMYCLGLVYVDPYKKSKRVLYDNNDCTHTYIHTFFRCVIDDYTLF